MLNWGLSKMQRYDNCLAHQSSFGTDQDERCSTQQGRNTTHTGDIKQSGDSPPGAPLSGLVERVSWQEWLLSSEGNGTFS